MAQLSVQLTQSQIDALLFLKGKKFDYLALDLAASLVTTGLVESNSTDMDNGSIASRLTAEGLAYIQTLHIPQAPVQQPQWNTQPSQGFSAPDVHFTGHNQLQEPVVKQVSSEVVPAGKGKKKAVPALKTSNAVEEQAVALSKFIINTVPLPASKKSAYFSNPKYPFADLEVGKGFFVPDSKEFPNAVRTLQSAASAANNRYAIKTSEKKLNRKGVEVAVVQYTRKFQVRHDIGTLEDGTENIGKKGARVGRVQ